MPSRWRTRCMVGLMLSCGCALEPKMPDLPSWNRDPLRDAVKDDSEPIKTVSFTQDRAESEVLPSPKTTPDKLPTTDGSGLQVPELKPLPINLPTALRLMNSRAWDIGIAAEGVRAASAQVLGANALWLPTLAAGVDFQHHDGPYQSPTTGVTDTTSHSNFSVGGSPIAFFATTDAIFEPLAARQTEAARKQQLQATTNDTTFTVAQAYFGVQEARGNLAGARDTIRRTKAMLDKITSMSPALVPRVEVSRARAQLSQFEQNEVAASERWNVSSAELVRILRMNPTSVVEPAEPPHLQITLISPDEPVERLLSVALANRPELAATRGLNIAAAERWKEERYRPFLPIFLLRGNSTQLPYSMAVSGFAGGQGFGLRDDWELQAMWELRNLGLGNLALIRARRAEMEATRMQAFRAQDLVAREVVQALAQVRSAAARVKQAEQEVREAVQSAEDNFVGLGETKRPQGNIVLLVIRPQEAMASVQALLQAYHDYYGTVADYNRSEFGLYRALGNPSQMLADPNGIGAECAKSMPGPARTNQSQGPQPPKPEVPLVPLGKEMPAPATTTQQQAVPELPPVNSIPIDDEQPNSTWISRKLNTRTQQQSVPQLPSVPLANPVVPTVSAKPSPATTTQQPGVPLPLPALPVVPIPPLGPDALKN